MNVGEWLRSLGLGHYEATFRENAIDDTVLLSLTAEDLKDLGIATVGHRRKLLDAIAALRAEASAKAPTPAALPGTERTAKDTAERRQVTVMFSDLVGSTALSARMDPEDLREVISAYQKSVAETVRRFDGFVAKYMGDGVLVYFGYPHAHEDDAERAVRAGLDIVGAIARLKTRAPEPLKIRVGIATGLVVVGDLIGSGEAQERGILGETPNLAARLQGIAEPNRVVIAVSTRRLLGNLFEVEDLGSHSLKGLAGPVRAWAAIRPSTIEGRFEAMHSQGLTALVGREEEFEILLRRWHRAKKRKGQVVLLSGEAGIGKSRLTAALLEQLAGEPHTRLRYFCSPQHVDSAFYPIVGQLERAAGFTHQDEARSKLDKLNAVLAQTSTSDADAALFAELLSLPNDGRYPALALTPQERRQRTLEALTLQVVGLASRQPVLMIFEDAHWTDPTSLEALSRTIERARSIPVLLIVTFRPEFAPPWVGQAHVTSLMLNRLGEHEIAAIIGRLVGNKKIPADVMAEIIERTDGIPLFVEEMTKAVLEAETEGAARRTAASVPSAALAVPASLHASLMARLDRLGRAKEVAQIGAAIGREFSHALLASVTRDAEAELETALDRLIQAGLVFRQGVPPHATYLFKHALVQDAAYGTLLREPRRALHARIAETLESQFAEVAESQPELLAHHCTEAGLIDRAVGYWMRAGKNAVERSANVEAISHLSKGLEGLKSLPEGPGRDRQELALLAALGTSLIAVHGYAAPQTGAAYRRARVLGERLGDAGALFATLSGEFTYHFVRGDYSMMRQLTDEARRTSDRMADSTLRLAAHRLSGLTAMHSGAFSQARSEFETILRLYEPSQHRPPAVHYVHDPKISALPYMAVTLWILGYPQQARRWSADALQYAKVLNQANLTAHVRVYGGAGLHELLGDTAAVREHADAIIDLAEQHNLHYFRLSGLILRGWVMAQEGEINEGVTLMRQSARERRELGVGWYQTRYLCMLATAHLQQRAVEEGLCVIAEAKDLVARDDDHMWEAELKRIEGELGRVQGTSAVGIETCFEHALAIARAQQAKSWELRAAMSMAQLWRDQGKRDEARDLLAPVYGWFTEGFDTLDLKEAKALLDALVS